MKIVWSPEAADDLEAAVEYLAQDSPAAAAKLGHGVLALVDRPVRQRLATSRERVWRGRTTAIGGKESREA